MTRAETQERLAAIMEETEARMHSTADVLREPQRSALHKRADAVTARAKQHLEAARRLRRPDST